MIKAEFGWIDEIDREKDYSEYEPEKYHCVAIDDDIYISDWWDRLLLMRTYHHRLSRPAFGLARWGVTIIPPESLAMFQDIVLGDRRIRSDEHLRELADVIEQAICGNKYMIHFGV